MTDFWRLVWQERCSVIIMLCNVKESNKLKCQQYWPADRSACYGPFSVALSATKQTTEGYVVRTLEVTVGLLAEHASTMQVLHNQSAQILLNNLLMDLFIQRMYMFLLT